MTDRPDVATPEIIAWLLEGDPAVRWQVHAYLLGSDARTVAAEQERVALEGWGARLLALQDPEGTWSGALYSPKWVSTHYTLFELRRLGLAPGHPQALRAARVLLDAGFLVDHGIDFSATARAPARRHAETCISGMCLAMFAYFGLDDERVHLLAEHMLGQQMADGGWNCRSYRGDKHSSFHTTTMTLEGLHEYALRNPSSALPLQAAMARGREFLLQHRLYRSHRTGEVVSAAMTRFPFPPRWQHDVLRALEHFAAAGAPRDERAGDAIELLRSKREAQGRWRQYRGPSGMVHFPIEAAGRPSRINTLRVLRVLRWWAEAGSRGVGEPGARLRTR